MKTGKIISRWIKLPVLVGFTFFLFVLALPKEGRSDGTLSNDAAQLTIADEEFAFVPGKAMLVEDHYILALYANAEKGHYALALFTAGCDSDDCRIGDLVAYSVFDAQGDDVQVTGSRQPGQQGIPNDHSHIKINREGGSSIPVF